MADFGENNLKAIAVSQALSKTSIQLDRFALRPALALCLLTRCRRWEVDEEVIDKESKITDINNSARIAINVSFFWAD